MQSLLQKTKTIGIGAGQMNRVGAAKIALKAAGDLCSDAVLASDGFFPFADTVELANEWYSYYSTWRKLKTRKY